MPTIRTGHVIRNKMICKWCNFHYENYLFILRRGCFTFSTFIRNGSPVDPKVAVIWDRITFLSRLSATNPTLFTPLSSCESVRSWNLLIKNRDKWTAARRTGNQRKKRIFPIIKGSFLQRKMI